MEGQLKNSLLSFILLANTILFAQDNSSFTDKIKEDILNVGPGIKLGGGLNASLIPSRQNLLNVTDGIVEKEEFKTMMNYAPGAEVFAALSPIQTDHFSYYFNVNGSLGWLGPFNNSILYRAHEFRLGSKLIKAVVEIGTFWYRRASFYTVDYSAANSYKQSLGYSSYEDIKRYSAGLNFRFKKGAELELRYIKENYNFDDRSADGASVSLQTPKKIKIYAECIWNHPVLGLHRVGIVDPNIEKEGIYARVGVTKTFGRTPAYRDLIRK